MGADKTTSDNPWQPVIAELSEDRDRMFSELVSRGTPPQDAAYQATEAYRVPMAHVTKQAVDWLLLQPRAPLVIKRSEIDV